ncbi:MAG: MOSC domain-containing protein [Rhodobacteraceae bacterium]|nr:MOSC domain-containing protein [Paracoccaceae bacterium]
MTARLKQIRHHPIKRLRAERLKRARLQAAAPLSGDPARRGLRHAGSAATGDWQPRRNFVVFVVVSCRPQLTRGTAQTRADARRLMVQHHDGTDLTVDPAQDGPAVVDRVWPLWPTQHWKPVELVHAPPCGMADNGLGQVSVMNLPSLRVLPDRIGQMPGARRFRGNLWVADRAPWEESDLNGKTVTISDSQPETPGRIDHYHATGANPDTGLRDVEPRRALMQVCDQNDFGVYATLCQGGRIAVGDAVTV